MTPTVLFVLSANYSGSTWLALLLGSHSRAAYVGELNKMFHDEPVPCRLCEERAQPCPVFDEAAAAKPRDIHARAFKNTGKDILVDNSKTLSWSRKHLGAQQFERKYLHLIRDPRAIAYSRVVRDRPVKIEKWIAKNREIREFVKHHALDCRQVLYNDLAEDTDRILSGVCHWLGVEFEPTQKSYWQFEHHGPGRNGATASFLQQYVASDDRFYEEHKKTNFHDLRWQEHLDPEIRTSIEEHPEMIDFLKQQKLAFNELGLAPFNQEQA